MIHNWLGIWYFEKKMQELGFEPSAHFGLWIRDGIFVSYHYQYHEVHLKFPNQSHVNIYPGIDEAIASLEYLRRCE